MKAIGAMFLEGQEKSAPNFIHFFMAREFLQMGLGLESSSATHHRLIVNLVHRMNLFFLKLANHR